MDELKVEPDLEESRPEKHDMDGDTQVKICKEDEYIVIVPSKDGPNGYKCKLCDVFYPKKWYLKLHIRTHTNERPYVCDFEGCNKSFARPGSLSEHKKRTHERVLSHACPICEKAFYDRSDMLTHIVIHDEARQTRERFLPEHMWRLLQEVDMFVFDGQEVFSHSVCDQCGKIFEKRSEVTRHVKGVHNRKFRCQVKGCAKSFFAQSGLDSHSMDHKRTVQLDLKPTKQQKVDITNIKCNTSGCEKGFSSNVELEKHLKFGDHQWGNIVATAAVKDGEIKTEFKCEFSECEKTFSDHNDLDKHVDKEDHDGNIFFICPDCPKKFVSSDGLKEHYSSHKEVAIEKNKTNSESVKNEFTEPQEYILKEEVNDVDLESPQKTYNFPCDLCDKYLSTNEALVIHKIIHAEKTKYKCEVEDCSLDFANRKTMLQHMRVDHGIEKTPDSRMFHMCPDCGKQFSTKSSMENHQIKHSDDKNFVCMECGKQFKRKESLHFHMKKHAGIEDCHCDQCPAKYVSLSALAAHKLAKHTDPADKEAFLCNFCGQSFNKKEYLKKHVTKHTGEKPYQCKECDKSFRSHGVYRNHLRVHRGIKDYKCSHCDKMFMQRQHLVVHERRHTGDKRHKCDECGKAFIEPATLRNHLKTHQNLNII